VRRDQFEPEVASPEKFYGNARELCLIAFFLRNQCALFLASPTIPRRPAARLDR
jgi:hypothetical protein